MMLTDEAVHLFLLGVLDFCGLVASAILIVAVVFKWVF